MRRYNDPTANAAIANVMRETRRKELEARKTREQEQRRTAEKDLRTKESGDPSLSEPIDKAPLL